MAFPKTCYVESKRPRVHDSAALSGSSDPRPRSPATAVAAIP